MIFDINLKVLESKVAEARDGDRALKHKTDVLVQCEDMAGLSKDRVVAAEVRMKTDLPVSSLQKGDYAAKVRITPYSIGGKTGLSFFIFAASRGGAK